MSTEDNPEKPKNYLEAFLKPDQSKNYLAALMKGFPRLDDRFGLPIVRPLLESGEDASERQQKVIELVFDCYEAARRNLEPELLKKVWKRASGKRRGRAKGSTKPDQDIRLLYTFDNLVANFPDRKKQWPALMGKILHEESPNTFGATPEAITKRLRRLLDKRRQEAVAAASMSGPGLAGFLSSLPPSAFIDAPPITPLGRDKKSDD